MSDGKDTGTRRKDGTADPFSALQQTAMPGPDLPLDGENPLAVRLRENSEDWQRACYVAEGYLRLAGPRFDRRIARIPGGDDVVGAALAALVMWSRRSTHVDTPAAVFGLVQTLRVDLTASDAHDGVVPTDSMLYRLLDRAEILGRLGLTSPEEAMRALLEHAHRDALLDALQEAVRPATAASTEASGGGNPYSSTNFTVTAVPPSDRTLDEVLAHIDGLHGLAPVKAFAREMADMAHYNGLCREAGLPMLPETRHLVFTGNPGTGKTMVARLVADLLHSSGAMPGATFVEANRSHLIGEWLGSTSLKVQKMADAAIGGVLFIDEAHSLAGSEDQGGDRFAHEALDLLVKVMEDEREDLVVILAGYPEGMQRLLDMNPGLRSRVRTPVHFPDYTADELVAIFEYQALALGQELGPDALEPVRHWAATLPRIPEFGNARLVRSVLEGAFRARAARLRAQKHDASCATPAGDLRTLTFADAQRGCRVNR